VEDREEVALVDVVVDLRPLAPREDVLDVERVPAEALGERLRLLERRRVEVDPGQPGGGELSRLARPLVDDREVAAASTADARQARHACRPGHRY